MLAFSFLIFGIFSRLIIHIDNFTPVLAVALFSGTYFSKRYAILLPLCLMIISDFFIGFHNTILFTWGAVALIAPLGFWIRQRKSSVRILNSAILSGLIFFVVTNFGVWLAGDLYPLTFNGLRECFVMAIPFFRMTLLSTLLYTPLIFGAYEGMARLVQKTKWAHALLNV